MHKHTYEAHKDKIKVENVITALFKDFKIRKQKVLQKIEHAYRSVLLDDQGHSPRLRKASVQNPVLRNPEFPLTAIIGITKKKRRRTCTQKLQSKA
jgi:hypothetical protein